MNLVEHARKELILLGQYEEDPEFSESLIKAVEAFASFGHSGGSAMIGAEMLYKLLKYENLSALTNDPGEWLDRTEYTPENPLWQNIRNSSCFSTDGGKTYYSLEDNERKIYTSVSNND
jgi:hypothetical protein